MSTVPIMIDALFIMIVVMTGGMFWQSSGRSRSVLSLIAGWMIVQSIVAVSGFYQVTDTLPPRFILLIAPPIVLILMLFLTRKGRAVLHSFSIPMLTYLQTMRIGAEIVLFLLAGVQFIPPLMTWQGSNFDIVTGITAPVVAYAGYTRRSISGNILLLWNAAGIFLLFNVMYHGILSSPSPVQQFSFDRPNLIPLYFPYILIPAFLVPVMLFAHLASIRSIFLTAGNPQ